MNPESPVTAPSGSREPLRSGAALLDCVEISTGPQPRRSVLWLHGLGADGHDFEPVVPHLRSALRQSVRFVFPHAPVRPVTLNGGMPMRAWYDIRSISNREDLDEAGVRLAQSQVDALLAREVERGVSAGGTVLAGFSQGGAMAVYAGLRHAQALAGLVCLSGYPLAAKRSEAERTPANQRVPVFSAHGTLDPVVPAELGDALATQLEGLGHPVQRCRYPIAHSVSMPEIADLAAWLGARLA